MGLPVDPNDFDRPEQTCVEIADGIVPEPAVDESRCLDDGVVVCDQMLRSETREDCSGGRVILILLAEQREQRGGID